MDDKELESMSFEEKVTLLKKESNDMNRLRIIRMFDNDEQKMEYASYIKDDDNRSGLTYSLKKLENKIKIIESLSDEKWIASAVIELPSDQYKIIFLAKVKNHDYKNRIIRSIKGNDKEILTELGNVEDEKDKALIISRMTDKDLKLEFLDEIKDDVNKSKIIMTVDDDNLKIEYIEKIEDETARTFLIASIKDEELREDYLKDYKMRYSNLDISDGMTVGMELEFEGENTIDAYLIGDVLDGWVAKADTSLENGAEITTPVLNNSSKKEIKNLYITCDILQGIGEEVSERCGGHIHFGADYLKTKDTYKNLIELWSNNEELFYILSNKEGEVTRENAISYASPLSLRMSKSIDDNYYNDYEDLSKEEFIEKIKHTQENGRDHDGRRTGINFLNVNSRNINTIEFRLPNGTIDANTWIENANLFGGLIAISQRISDIQNKNIGEINEEDKSILEKFVRLRNKDISNDERLNMLLDLCVPEKLKQIYINRYNENSKLLEENTNIKEKISEHISDNTVIFPIGEHVEKNARNITTSEKVNNFQDVTRELREIEKDLERPTQSIDNIVSLDS